MGGLVAQRLSNHACPNFRGQVIYSFSDFGDTKFCALRWPFCRFSEESKDIQKAFLGGTELKSHPKTKIPGNKIRQPSTRCLGAVKIFP